MNRFPVKMRTLALLVVILPLLVLFVYVALRALVAAQDTLTLPA